MKLRYRLCKSACVFADSIRQTDVFCRVVVMHIRVSPVNLRFERCAYLRVWVRKSVMHATRILIKLQASARCYWFLSYIKNSNCVRKYLRCGAG